jgi:hypothetical protein
MTSLWHSEHRKEHFRGKISEEVERIRHFEKKLHFHSKGSYGAYPVGIINVGHLPTKQASWLPTFPKMLLAKGRLLF